MNKHIVFASTLVFALVIATIGTLTYFAQDSRSNSSQANVTDYDSCVAAGNVVEQSYPARCSTPDGRSFVQNIGNTPDSFDECVELGYPVQESYPRRCSTPDGRSFTEIVSDPPRSTIETLSRESKGIEKVQQVVITDEASYEKLWADMVKSSERIDLKRPEVDFSQQVVIGVFAGPKGSGGHSIEIQSVIHTNGKYQVQVQQTRPGDSCTSTSVMTYPSHLVAYTFDKPSSAHAPLVEWAPPTAADFTFVTNTRVDNCYAD